MAILMAGNLLRFLGMRIWYSQLLLSFLSWNFFLYFRPVIYLHDTAFAVYIFFIVSIVLRMVVYGREPFHLPVHRGGQPSNKDTKFKSLFYETEQIKSSYD